MLANVRNRMLWMWSILAVAALACQVSASAPASAAAPAATIAPEAATPTSAASSPEPEFSGVAPIDLPAKRADQGGDVDSSVDATRKMVPGGDVFVHGLYERPFNADTMDTYFPYLDIIDTQGFKDDLWGYATITLAGTDTNGGLPGTYGVELDLNRDGRGDWLILASNPSSMDWTTQGVQTWQDADGDVGGSTPLFADKKPSNGNGYDRRVFASGQTGIPDGAWVRRSTDKKTTIQIAFKLSMLGDPKSFAMGAWAGSGDVLNPAMFDFNDHLTHAEAGSPLPSYQVYPLKQLAEVDNTCRLAIGFAPTGREQGLCTVPVHVPGEGPAPTEVPPPYIPPIP